MKNDNPWFPSKQIIKNKYNAVVHCRTLGDALDVYTYLLSLGYNIAISDTPYGVRHVLNLNRDIFTWEHIANCSSICDNAITIDEWCKIMNKKSDTNKFVNCGNNINLFKAVTALTDEKYENQWYIWKSKNSGEKWIFGDKKEKDIKQAIDNGLCRKATLEEIIEHFNNIETKNSMAEIATKEEYLPILEELFDTAMPCSKNFMKESFANFYYNTSAEVSPKTIEIKEFEEVFNEIFESFFPKEDKLGNKKVFISIPITGQEELARERCENIKKILSENYPTCEVFTPFEVAPKKNMPDSYYMGKDVEQLLNCDVMIQMDGWEKSKGCTVEDCIAKTYSIPIIKENQILD